MAKSRDQQEDAEDRARNERAARQREQDSRGYQPACGDTRRHPAHMLPDNPPGVQRGCAGSL